LNPRTDNCFDQRALDAAGAATSVALRDFFASVGNEHATVLKAPAGAGKSGTVALTIGPARRHRMRLAIATPTNDQAFALVGRIAASYPTQTITFVPASNISLPEHIARLPNVAQVEAAQANGASVIVGTLSKLGDAFCRGTLTPVDGLVMDEAFQADSSRYYGIADLAPTHLLVGDSGQLNPFSTMPDPYRWRGLPEDPLQTAVGVLLRNHDTRAVVHNLPITRRLDHRAAPVIRAFYPDLSFETAVLPGVRKLRLDPATTTSRTTRLIDQALEVASRSGWAHVELPPAPVLQADPEMIDLIIALVRRLFERHPQLRCERNPSWTDLQPRGLAIGVSHNDQKDLLRFRLDGAGFPQVVVETANKLQGLEFELVIAWHPLAGIPEPDEFHLDPGRLCVLLTRHRHSCIVLGRASDRHLLDALPPATPAFLGWDPDAILDGWEVHRAVFRMIEQYRLTI
jgi:hypothetical protein